MIVIKGEEDYICPYCGSKDNDCFSEGDWEPDFPSVLANSRIVCRGCSRTYYATDIYTLVKTHIYTEEEYER